MICFILKQFNNYHKRLKFTLENMNNNSLNFLDLNITREDNIVTLDWFQKRTSSGRLLSFLSYHPIHQKVGVIYNILLLHPKFHKNICFCINTLLDNGYPLDMIFRLYQQKNSSLSIECP